MTRLLIILALLLAFPASAQFNGCAPGPCNTAGSAAVTWSERTSAGTGDWDGCAISSDGQKMVAVDQDGNALWISTNGGALFTHSVSAGAFEFVAVGASSDFMFIAATVTDTGGGDPGVRYSLNGGTTWNNTAFPTSSAVTWIGVSGDGSLIAVAANDFIYLSTDMAATFAASAGAGVGGWSSISVSRDSTTVVATDNSNSKVWITTNAGVAWNDRTPDAVPWFGSAVSSDGSKITVANNTSIWRSTNSGVAFSELASTTTFNSGLTATSDDGASILVYRDAMSNLSRSTNSGVAWATQDPPGALASVNAIASSANGKTVIAVDNGGSIWTASFP